MLNQTVVVGRLINISEIKELENNKKVTTITLAVPRSYKNANGEYETDFIDFILWNGVAENTSEYCKKGDLIGVKGRIQTTICKKDGKKTKETEIVAEKVTFLTSSNKEKNEKKSNN